MQLVPGDLALVAALRSPTWMQPLWMVALGAVGAVGALYLLTSLLRIAVPRVAAIMDATAKEAVSQPLFYLLIAIGVAGLILFPFLSYNTLGEDVKMLKAEGLTLIKVLAILLALWTASVSIAEEIEGRTALTVLSKPLGRRELVFGKFLGILWPVLVMFIILGTLFLCTVSFKVQYDARETSSSEPTAAMCAQEMAQITPGLVLSFMETAILAAISVAISTRLSLVPNLIICLLIYILGHLVPTLVNSSVGQFELVQFAGRFLAAVLPVLEHFSMETVISTGQAVPPMYLGLAALYCVMYTAVAMLLALLLFEDRDLA